jgi:hypothetical protein
MSSGDEIFTNLPEELQKKYIGLGNELSAGMVRGLTPSGMSYYVSKKKEKLLQKSLKDLSENDMEVVLSKEMKPYLRSLKEKYRNELSTDFKPNFVGIAYPSDANAKYARMFGLEELFDLIPADTRFLQIENKSKDKVILKIPASISKFTNVRTLVFENIVNEIPEEIGSLKRLSFLNLTNNEELTTLPESITEIYCLDFISVLGSTQLIDGTENLPEKVKNFFDISPKATLWDTNRPDEYFDLCDEAEQTAP